MGAEQARPPYPKTETRSLYRHCDARYRRFDPQPKPNSQAVMFCLMDVSGSMSEHMKDLAKRFYMLLYIFLVRCYGEGRVKIVFIRHTDRAEEVDEKTFFYDPASGGT